MNAQREHILVESASAPFFVGVDVGGTNTKIGLVDDDGRTIAFSQIPTDEEKGLDDAVARFAQAIRDLLADSSAALDSVARVGLGTPGSMNIPEGLILEPPNMPHWRNYPIRDRLAEACGKAVSFANDANAAAYGEYWIGSGRGHKSMIMLTLGTGVGGGVIVEGKSIDGNNSFGSECGHIVIDCRENARTCVWGGGRGELEAYASASAVVRFAQEELENGCESSVRARVNNGEQLSPLMLCEEAEKGDDFSMRIILETARILGVGVVSLVHVVDPGIVVLGGAMNFGGNKTKTGRRFLNRVREEFRSRAYPVVRDTTVIDYATLGSDAGYIGAAGIARADYQAETSDH